MTALPLYQISDWNDHFESAKSRMIQRCANTYAPNKHGGSGWSNVMGEADGAAIWGIWKMILDICSRQMRPREGWLTADGRKAGRRLAARELSNQLRRPIEEIHRALQILQSPEVAFVRLIEGHPEHLAGSPDGYREATHLAGAYPKYGERRGDTGVSREHPEGVSERDIQRRNEEQNNNSLSRDADVERQQANTAGTDDRHTRDTATATGGQAADVVQHAEAKLILGKLAKDVFPDEAPGAVWDNKLEHDLDEMLPLNRQALEKVDWAYRLPETDRLFEDGPRGGGMMKVKSFASLIPNLKREASKVASARRKLGLNGLHDPKKEMPAAPAQWEEAFVALWGERPDRPRQFEELTTTQQAAVKGKCRELEGAGL